MVRECPLGAFSLEISTFSFAFRSRYRKGAAAVPPYDLGYRERLIREAAEMPSTHAMMDLCRPVPARAER
jgi:hypothetical protein